MRHLWRRLRQQRVCEFHQIRLQIARICVHSSKLRPSNRLDAWMRMTYMRDIVICVEVRPSPLVVHVRPPGAHEQTWLGVTEPEVGGEASVPLASYCFHVERLIHDACIWQVEQRRWIGTHGTPVFQVIRIGNAGPVVSKQIRVERELQMEMRIPTAVLGWVTQLGERFAFANLLTLSQT